MSALQIPQDPVLRRGTWWLYGKGVGRELDIKTFAYPDTCQPWLGFLPTVQVSLTTVFLPGVPLS
jgi:hypothetical protein